MSSEMNTDGRQISLKDAVQFIVDNRGKTAPTEQDGIALIATNCVNNKDLYPQKLNLRFVSKDTYDNWFRSHPKPGDILLTNKGSQNGAVCLVPNPVDFCIAQDMVALRADPKKVSPLYLFAALRSDIVQKRIKALNVDAVIPHLKKTDFDKLFIPLPDSKTQEWIGNFYFELSSRIELLSETNATLEAIAQALFKSWFVDFDPVHAKQQGRIPEGMDEATAALFPDSFEESAMGLAPKGWLTTTLKKVLIAKNERVGNLQVPEYSSTNHGLVPRSQLYNKQLAVSSSKNKLVRKGDIVFGLSRKVLNFGFMQDDIGSVSSAYKVYAIDNNQIKPELLARLIETRKDYFFNAVSASSREGQSVSDESLGILGFVYPPKYVQEALMKYMAPLLAQATLLQGLADTLSELRDTLLPRLISGQLRQPEAEAELQLEEATL